MADAKMLNKQKTIGRLKKIPQTVQTALAPRLEEEVENLVQAQRRAAPVGGKDDPHPGTFRDSIHKYENPDRPLSWRVIADAKDPQGRNVGRNVEFGHRNKDGTYTPARPSFFPTYRAQKKPMRNRLNAATRAAFRDYVKPMQAD